jgi:PIN domain nuclease of toxin-antitoxin system
MWLHDGLIDRISPKAADMIEAGRLYYSLMAELELQYLHEIGWIRPTGREVIRALAEDIGLQCGEKSFSQVARKACELTWTRDPFDRLISAEAVVAGGLLLSRDALILQHCEAARWAMAPSSPGSAASSPLTFWSVAGSGACCSTHGSLGMRLPGSPSFAASSIATWGGIRTW